MGLFLNGNNLKRIVKHFHILKNMGNSDYMKIKQKVLEKNTKQTPFPL